MTSIPTLDIREMPLLMPSSEFDDINNRMGSLERKATVTQTTVCGTLTSIEELEERVASLEEELGVAAFMVAKFQKFYEYEKELWMLNKQALEATNALNQNPAANEAHAFYRLRRLGNGLGSPADNAEYQRLSNIAHDNKLSLEKSCAEIQEKLRMFHLNAKPF
jgi:uncharacterized small protein (DUF1192 family)